MSRSRDDIKRRRARRKRYKVWRFFNDLRNGRIRYRKIFAPYDISADVFEGCR